MSADLIFSALSLAKGVTDVIRNGPKAQRELEDLNNRCCARLSSLLELGDQSTQMMLDDRAVTGFVEETAMTLQEIIDKFKPVDFVDAIVRQDEIQDWVARQTRKMDDRFQMMIVEILVTNVRRQMMQEQMRASQEQDRDEVLSEIRSLLRKLSSHFQSEPLDEHLVRDALERVENESALNEPRPNQKPRSPPLHSEAPSLPPIQPLHSLSFRGLIPSPVETPPQTIITDQPAPRTVPAQPPDVPLIFKKRDGKIYGNPLGLVDHWLQTEDERYKHIMLKTYLDHTTPEELFDYIELKFQEARPETPHFVARRTKLVDVIVSWVPTIPRESLLFQRARDFASESMCNLIPDHSTKILEAIKNYPRTPISSRSPGQPVEPLDPEELALALTHMEYDFHQTFRCIDYLLYAKGAPSRIDTWLLNHRRMIRWVKYSVLRHDEISDRVDSMKRFIKAGQNCLRRQNYNSMAAIATALDLRVKPMCDLSRTLEQLSRDKRSQLEELTTIIDPDQSYEAYNKKIRKIRGDHKKDKTKRKGNSPNYIPWCIAELDAITSHLLQYPATVDDLINFERYEELGVKLVYEVPPELQGNRQGLHIEYLRDKIDAEGYDEEAENRRRRWLRKREEDDYQKRRPQWRDAGFEAGGRPKARAPRTAYRILCIIQ